MRWLLLVPLLSASCVEYGCAQLRLFDTTFDEQCGPGGSQGTLYFGDDMVTLIIGADFEDFLTEESSMVYDYVPTVRYGFREVHLEPAVSLGTDQTVVQCGRSEGLGTFYRTWPGTGTLEVVEPSRRAQVGGQAWRFRWDAGCDPEADIEAHGDDIIELFVVEHGWDPGLWGLPPDWPRE